MAYGARLPSARLAMMQPAPARVCSRRRGAAGACKPRTTSAMATSAAAARRGDHTIPTPCQPARRRACAGCRARCIRAPAITAPASRPAPHPPCTELTGDGAVRRIFGQQVWHPAPQGMLAAAIGRRKVASPADPRRRMRHHANAQFQTSGQHRARNYCGPCNCCVVPQGLAD